MLSEPTRSERTRTLQDIRNELGMEVSVIFAPFFSGEVPVKDILDWIVDFELDTEVTSDPDVLRGVELWLSRAANDDGLYPDQWVALYTPVANFDDAVGGSSPVQEAHHPHSPEGLERRVHRDVAELRKMALFLAMSNRRQSFPMIADIMKKALVIQLAETGVPLTPELFTDTAVVRTYCARERSVKKREYVDFGPFFQNSEVVAKRKAWEDKQAMERFMERYGAEFQPLCAKVVGVDENGNMPVFY